MINTLQQLFLGELQYLGNSETSVFYSLLFLSFLAFMGEWGGGKLLNMRLEFFKLNKLFINYFKYERLSKVLLRDVLSSRDKRVNMT